MLQIIRVFFDEGFDLVGIGCVFFFAIAELFGQALRQNAQQRIGKVKWVHAHIEQANDGLGRAVGVKRGEHQVACERGFHAHTHGFFVARFADHDDVGIGTQEGAHDHRKINAGFFVDLHLAQAFLRDFHRVFCCPNFGVGLVEKFQHRVQGGGFARACGAANVEQAIGLGDGFFKALAIVRREAEFIHRNGLASGKDTHHHIFHTTR